MSGSIGRPLHFSDLSCDVEQPVFDDVYEAIGEDNEEKVMYLVEMAKLSVICKSLGTPSQKKQAQRLQVLTRWIKLVRFLRQDMLRVTKAQGAKTEKHSRHPFRGSGNKYPHP